MLANARFTRILVSAFASFLLAGCVSSQQTGSVAVGSSSPESPDEGSPTDEQVHQIKLSELIGEVGRPYESRLVHEDNFIEEAEYSVDPVPPGLEFDPETGVLKGVPTKAGFYRLTVAVRERPEDEPHFITPDERWWTEETELAIYQPVE